MTSPRPFSSVLLLIFFIAAPVLGSAVVFEANGANAAAIQAKVDAFRAALGPSNAAGAPAPSGRREVNWDGVALSALDPFPGGFFNSTSPRGLVLSTPGTRMKVSGDPGTASFLMRDVTAQEWGVIELASFSPERIFAPIGSVITDVNFFVPGTSGRATVRGFGAVFVDVDVAGATRLEAFDAQGKVIFSRAVAPSGALHKGLSFVGFLFDAGEIVARVRIINGTNPVDSPFQDPPPDGVGIDDLIYAEPEALTDSIAQTTWIPAAINSPGVNGTDWHTDLAILNPSGFAASYHADFIQSGTIRSISGTLAAGQQDVLNDVVARFIATGTGVIRVLSDQPLTISANTYDQLAAGRYGSSTFGRSDAGALHEGEVALLPNLQQDAAARTNIGVTNTGAKQATVNVTLFDATGAVASFDLILAPRELRQENAVFVTRAGKTNVTSGSARIVVKFGSGIHAYGSVVDNITGDPRQQEMLLFR